MRINCDIMGKIAGWKIKTKRDNYIEWYNKINERIVSFEKNKTRTLKYRINVGWKSFTNSKETTKFGLVGLVFYEDFSTKTAALEYARNYMRMYTSKWRYDESMD